MVFSRSFIKGVTSQWSSQFFEQVFFSSVVQLHHEKGKILLEFLSSLLRVFCCVVGSCFSWSTCRKGKGKLEWKSGSLDRASVGSKHSAHVRYMFVVSRARSFVVVFGSFVLVSALHAREFHEVGRG